MFRKLFNWPKSGGKTPGINRYGIDEECNYCPQCGEAYRAEIKTCAACSVPLIPGSEKLAGLNRQETSPPENYTEISADDELATIQTGKLGQLKPLQHILKAAYIPSLLAGDGASRG